METNKSKGGRPRDPFADYVVAGEHMKGKPIKKCIFCGHPFSINASVTRIKAHLGKVKDQGVALCTVEVPSNVEEAARKAITSLSSKRSNANIPSNSDMLQPPPQGCYTSGPPPPQTMQSAQEQCPGLLNVCQQQSNVDPMDVRLYPLLQDNTRQFPPQGCSASGPPPQNMPLDVPMQRTNGMQLDPSGMGTGALGHESLREKSNLSEDFDQLLSTLIIDPQFNMNEMQLNTPQPIESCSMHGVSASPHPVQQHPREPYQDMLQDASRMDSVHDTSIPQELLREPWRGVLEIPPSTPQHNENCSAHSTLVPQCPKQQHQREDHNHLLDKELLQDAAGMDSTHDATTPQNLLQGGERPSSFPDSTHQDDMAIVESGDHEGLRSQNHMRENLQGDQGIISLDHDPYTSIVPQLHHVHIDRLLQSSDTSRSTSNQAKHNKRKLGKCPIGKKLLMGTIFQGSTFNKKVDEIYKYLENDSVSRIGVYGMGGSGKTTIMKHIHNLLLEDYSMPFGDVMWVTVSQDHTIPKLQRHLASKLHITLPHDEDQVAWAATLYEKMGDMCYVLILDDVWDEINLAEVGIPEPSQKNRCKLILTTRLLDVCNKMNCNQPIFLDLFSQEEAWELFVKTLDVTPEDSIIQGIMKEVAKKCGCLPLAIATVAGSMKGIHDICEWRYALDSLKSRTDGFTDMGKKVIDVLKFSYHRLSQQLQQCLLSCALFPDDHTIKREELIEMLIMEGYFRNDKSRRSAYNQGHTIFNKLENACLLTKSSFDDELVIHDLIRDMCLDIMGGRFLVKCSSRFPPEESEYTEVLEKASLMNSEFEEITLNMPPNCPKLSSLLLSENEKLTRMSDSFFTNFPGLKVLNLCDTSIQVLPSSVTNLVSLNALVLRRCHKLRCLPCLTPLKALKQLDLSYSGIKEPPEGLEELVNLTYLDLEYTPIETPVSSSILTNLVKLQHLRLPDSTKIMMKDVREFKNLEVLQAVFADWEEFSEYVNSGRLPYKYYIDAKLTRLGASRASMSYKIFRNKEEGSVGAELGLREDHNTIGENRLSSEVIGQIPSPEVVRHLLLRGLRSEQTRENGELKGIFGATVLFPFSNLVKLNVARLEFTKDLISASSSVVESTSSPKVLLSCFQNLQVLTIMLCRSLESILVSTANPTEEEEENNNPISFPNLRRLTLVALPNLRSICDGTLICPSIESIEVQWCPKLKRLPLQLPPPVLGSNNNNNNNSGQLSLPPPLSSLKEINGRSEWWESLEWDQPHAKALLQPYFKEIILGLEWL